MRDRDVRVAVLQRLSAAHADDPNTRIVQEMGVWSGSVRIDVAVINGELCGFELKSDRDTLDRLPTQADIYSRVFDKVELVVGKRHAEKAEAIVPKWWGIMVAREQSGVVTLKPKRMGTTNPTRDPHLIAQLLWKEEAIAVLEACGLAAGWRSKTVKKIHQRLATELPLDDLRDRVRQALKARADWLGQSVPNQLDVAIDTNLDPSL
jgi:hypothetical protein